MRRPRPPLRTLPFAAGIGLLLAVAAAAEPRLATEHPSRSADPPPDARAADPEAEEPRKALPIPELDDRKYRDLRDELLERTPAHTPEWTNPEPGDPSRTHGIDPEAGKVRFGDGAHGRRPPTVPDDAKGAYRHGSGEAEDDGGDDAAGDDAAPPDSVLRKPVPSEGRSWEIDGLDGKESD